MKEYDPAADCYEKVLTRVIQVDKKNSPAKQGSRIIWSGRTEWGFCWRG